MYTSFLIKKIKNSHFLGYFPILKNMMFAKETGDQVAKTKDPYVQNNLDLATK